MSSRTAPAGPTDSAEQDGIGVSTQLAGGSREGGAGGINGRAADQARPELELMAVTTADRLQDPNSLRRYFRSDAIPAQNANQGFHGRVFSKRLMASA